MAHVKIEIGSATKNTKKQKSYPEECRVEVAKE